MLQVGVQAPFVQTGVALVFWQANALLQPPQLLVFVSRFTSQPFAVLPSQERKLVLHDAITQAAVVAAVGRVVVLAGGRAVAAVVVVGLEGCLAAVGRRGVAVRVVGVASAGFADLVHADAVGVAAREVVAAVVSSRSDAAAAMVRVGRDVDLAVGVVAVAIAVRAAAGLHLALAALALGRGVRDLALVRRTHRSARRRCRC